MFENLQDGLKSAFKSLSGKGKLTEANMRDGLKIVEQSLLEADVSYEVVQHFMQRVSEQAMGEKVLLSLKPHEQLIGVVHSELVGLLGPVDDSLHLKKDGTTIIMMCGLQGSGKTTTCGKLSVLLKQNKITPLLVAADLQRPAAIDQLHVIGEQLGVPVYSEKGEQDPIKVCRNAVKQANENGNQVVILDTAGRLAIDEELMEQLRDIDRQLNPDQVYLVVDGMTGQDAVRSAAAFHESLELNGVVMTKLDGDARGGALLSVKHVTGVPIKFIGTGEQMDALEPFRPEGMAGRILGQGDIVELARQAQTMMDEKEQERLQEQLSKGEFTLDDFRNQMQKIAQPGLMQRMIGLMPGVPKEFKEMLGSEEASSEIRRQMAIIDSMTPSERQNPKIIQVARRQRIAKGSGVEPKQVNDLIKQYDMMKPMLTGMAGKNRKESMEMVQELQSKMMDPSSRMPKTKKSTGKRLSAKERKKSQKDRQKRMRQMKREKRENS
ncbi:MAG: signal recognition particle protein [Planctomycetaceae bacterium]|nr:signal recognition particle protein [Planctomycetaceae bacterium]MCP4461991.1 signal recognition particle protein [Planctomycetaceae bacterium]MDG1810100.1 signal recognition particle protein [Pirellulaceae bacterium]MDG2104743.1 signal recognition particle protein [Pirellulaceae bacterium]